MLDESKHNISSSPSEQDLEFKDSEYADYEFYSDFDDEIKPKTAQFPCETKISRNDAKLSGNKN